MSAEVIDEDQLPPVTPESLRVEVENNAQRLADIEVRVITPLKEKVENYGRSARCGRRIDGCVIALLVVAVAAVLGAWTRIR
jgi:tetrahydromethanopterin S-methyltransferase subunit G